MTLVMSLRKLRREWRSGELLILTVALVVAVAAMTAVSFFTDRVGKAVTLQAAEVLAADLVLSSGREIDQAVYGRAADYNLQTARRVSFPSVVLAGDDSTLADIEGVSGGYPLRGQLRVADSLLGALGPIGDIPAPGEAWAESRLLARLGVDTGVRLEVGEHSVVVTRVLDFAPDRGWRFADLAPGLMINLADIEKTGLIQPGSRVRYTALFAGDSADIGAFRSELDMTIAEHENLRDLSDLQPEMRSAVDRAGRFLSLAALVAALLAAVALSMAARRYAAKQLDQVALMKCLGASQRRITLGVTIELVILAVVGGLLGSLLGWLAQQGLVWVAGDLIGAVLPAPSPRTIVFGVVISIILLAGFALPPLIALRQVPPARVLHRDLPPAQVSRWSAYAAAIGAVVAILLWLIRDVELVIWLGLGALATVLLLYGAGWGFVLAVRRFRGAGGFAWRYGIASIGRRGNDSVIQVIGFGLGLMALLLLTVVRNDLLQSWRETLPADAPNHFMINIDPSEVDDVSAFLLERTGRAPQLAPLVRARLIAIDGVDIADIEFSSNRGRRFAERESNLSWSSELSADNKIDAGRWWGKQPQPGGEVSVEVDFAESLGIGLGDRLRFDVAGEIVEVPVTSFRVVEWDSFQPNFFMVFSP
ncbi:MAG: FtsX-like permease family protein, partial [Gammaproteobacteria bacterium]|nr:FtsX-like permease family protein [Gammaproteobacteria bacterium]